MHDPSDYVTSPSGENYTDLEQRLANDHNLSQPPSNPIPWTIGILTLVGVLIVVGWIIITTVAGFNILITIAAVLLIFAPWVWLIERGNRHPH